MENISQEERDIILENWNDIKEKKKKQKNQKYMNVHTKICI